MPDTTQLSDIAFDFPEPAAGVKSKTLSLWATYYYVYAAKALSAGIPLLDKRGKELGPKLSEKDFCLAAIEGTVWVKDAAGGVVYNFAGTGSTSQCNCASYAPRLSASVKAGLGRTRWVVSQAPFGLGVKNLTLVPYRSIAVDEDQIPYGSVIYIPLARGAEVKLPSGKVAKHDGYFYAADKGGAVNDNHIDVFSGVSNENPFKNFIKSKATGTFQAFLIKDDRVAAALDALHGKS